MAVVDRHVILFLRSRRDRDEAVNASQQMAARPIPERSPTASPYPIYLAVNRQRAWLTTY
jgi:hypothetical protein